MIGRLVRRCWRIARRPARRASRIAYLRERRDAEWWATYGRFHRALRALHADLNAQQAQLAAAQLEQNT